MLPVILFCALIGASFSQPGSPLYEYVQRPDPSYSYEEIAQYVQNGITTYIVNLTAHTWFDETWTNRPVWFHYLAIHIPDNIDPDFTGHAFIYVSTGDNDDSVPNVGSRHVRETGVYANRTGMVTAALRQIPNQPLRFTGTSMDLDEDALIAYTWRVFLESNATANPEILLRFPMCKSVARAMDTVTSFTAEKLGSEVDIQSFMIAGESKRGWTTWMMPAADDRVVAMAPVVLSCLNLNENMHHYWRSFGNWTFAFTSYWLENITPYVDSPFLIEMQKYIDPFSYRDTMTMPKLMVSGASDEFFMPDDYNYFFDDLPGEKYMWLLENSGHSINGSPLKEDYWRMLETFYVAVIRNHPRPTFSWTQGTNPDGSGFIEVTTSSNVISVLAQRADTPEVVAPRRDFRLERLNLTSLNIEETGIYWDEFAAQDLGGGTWRIAFVKPDEGYRAFFLKLTFAYNEDPSRHYTFSTKAQILSFDVDNEFPFPDCTGEGCTGFLV